MTIWGVPASNLGDLIAFFNWLSYPRRMRHIPNSAICDSPYRHHKKWDNCKDKLEELIGIFQFNMKVIEEIPNTRVPLYPEIFALEFKSPPGFSYKGGDYICCQLDGNIQHGRDDIPEQDRPGFVRSLSQLQPVTKLGKHMSIKTCFKAIQHCSLFVGVNSGMAHIAFMVGAPVLLVLPKTWNVPSYHLHNKKFHLAKTLEEGLNMAEHLTKGKSYV